MSRNDLQKKVIQALANAPKTALQELIKTSTKDEGETIKRIASALNIKL